MIALWIAKYFKGGFEYLNILHYDSVYCESGTMKQFGNISISVQTGKQKIVQVFQTEVT